MLASLELQRALAAALNGDAVLSAAGIAAVDGAEAGAGTPYLSIGADRVSERGWKGGGAMEHRFTVTLWDRREGMAAAKALMAEVERVVLAMAPVLPGGRLISLRLLRATVRRTPRNGTEGVLEFRAVSVREN
jgi:hypothetical protein